ncbi:mRNA export factor GLE1 [Rutidosis leptorrhynchoides]|uniref:mRNA export factor GLE1 n=1 Tax=Rutidosis leptorrhynchoides TaxID=125765 RepID=UPI003A9A2448
MGIVQFDIRCPQCVGGMLADPHIDWSFDDLITELNTIDEKLQASTLVPLHFSKTQSSELSANDKNRKAFVMRVSDDEGYDEDEDENNSRHLVVDNRFDCKDLSDGVDSDCESADETQWSLMDKGGVIEGALIELSHDHQLSVADEIRNRISAFRTDLTNEKEKFTNALSRADKCKEARLELDRKRDLQFQRQIAEELDNHLTDVQRHHEYKSQIEEKKIRDDAAVEEAKRKQKAFQEEKVRQEKMKAEEAKHQAEKKKEEEAKAKAKAKALEAERVAKEAADLAADVAERQKAADALNASKVANIKGSSSGEQIKASEGNVLKASNNAIKMEEKRVQLYNEMVGKDFAMELVSNKEYGKLATQMGRRIKTISGAKENVRTKAVELVQLINSPLPQSANIAIFAEKLISLCTSASSNGQLYGYGHVIVMVTSKFPLAMDILLAKLNKVCIFTVPKYLSYSETAFESRDAYYRAIGYQEKDGKLETTDDYLMRLTNQMKLYGALVQTQVNGIRNLHGIEEGWKWLAMFLNALPANLHTLVALDAFIEMAGFGLYRRYKNQFEKLINIISGNFIRALKERKDARLIKVLANLEEYVESNKFKTEPEGWRLRDSLDSSNTDHIFKETNYQQPYHNSYSYRR